MQNIHLFREKLTKAFTKELPGPKSHLELAHLERVEEVKRLAKPKNAKESAVLVILFPENDEIHLLLIQRTIYNGAHSGQISFPGGKVEETDVDYIHTALRETEEEIGLSVLSQQIVGKLSNIYIPPSNFVVEPFVAVIDQLNDLKLNFSEVETIYKIP
ncbi:MAG: CoA pyrophosphatase, partial [Bacteroidales bacterium]|nr:CoA pyrophosphatase [Bacteroidales bacterium]